jgi:hypothetical protein
MSAPTPEIIATWPTPNYDNPKSIKTPIEAVVYSTTIAMLLFVGSRIFVRTKSKLGMGVDDWFMIAAAVRIGTTLFQRISKRHRSSLASRPRPFFTARSMSLDAIFTTLGQISFPFGSKLACPAPYRCKR